MKNIIHSGLLILLMLFNIQAHTADNPLEFSEPGLEERYYALIEEIRCLVCQNQSLSDSHADLAQDLRNEIYKKVLAGDDDEQIVTFLVERYGDFVLYRPPFTKNTWLLWLGPFLFMLLGIVIAIIAIKKQSREPNAQSELDSSQQQRLTEILSHNKNNGDEQ